MTSGAMKGLAAGVLVGLVVVGVAVARRAPQEQTMSTAAAEVLATSSPTVEIYKSATCGCCGQWAEYMRGAGFKVVEHNVEDIAAVTSQAGVPNELASCHVAHVGGYVIEGHVPAEDIKKMLAEKPAIAGLAVPGMVAGSPGMDSPTPQHYDVIAYDKEGATSVYAKH